MTACLYIEPKGFPAILTDVLETWDGLDLQTIVIPGTLLGDAPRYSRAIDPIVRKLFFPTPRLAIALSGITESITSFLKDLGEQIDIIINFPNPLEPIYEMLSGYEDKINVLVVYMTDRGPNVITWGPTENIPPFGRVAAIGSGSDSLIKSTKWYGENTRTDILHLLSPYNLFADCFCKQISSMISNELIFGNPRDWGGFGEWGYYDVGRSQWVYSEPSLFAFLLAIPLSSGRFTLMNTSYFFCYDSGSAVELSAVFAVYFYHGQVHLKEWPLGDLTRPDLKGPRQMDRWIGWKPTNLTFQIFPYGKEALGSITRCIYPNQRDSEITVTIEPNKIELTTSAKIVDEWGNMAAAAWGLEYVPQSSISEADMQQAYFGARKGGWDRS